MKSGNGYFIVPRSEYMVLCRLLFKVEVTNEFHVSMSIEWSIAVWIHLNGLPRIHFNGTLFVGLVRCFLRVFCFVRFWKTTIYYNLPFRLFSSAKGCPARWASNDCNYD